MSAINVRAAIDTIRTFNSASLTGTYQVFGSAFTHEARMLRITNGGSTTVTLSLDGVNDMEVVVNGTVLPLEFAANRETSNQYELPSGTQVWIKGTAGTGTIYLSVYYAS